MKSKNAGFVTGMLVLLLSAPAAAQSSKDWVDIKNAKELRALYSNKTFKGKGPDGTPFVGHYRSDGKGILITGGQRIPRTWEVKGNDQVCVTDARATNCFRAQRHKKNRNDIVLQHVTAGWISQFTVEDGIPQF